MRPCGQRPGAAPLLLLAIAAEAPGCGETREAERFIQGTWFYSGTVPGDPQHPRCRS
jgi:hypothetical protein